MNAVTATSLAPPPPWAFMQRRLIETMEQATEAMLAKYTEPGGALYFADDVDDLYERFANWSLFYAVGAHERVAQMALQQWNATTRWCDDGVVNRRHHNEFHMNLGERGRLRRTFNPQIHNEYYNLAEPAGAEWHHKGEGNMAFYHFGLAHPHSSENVRRARRFAAMYMGEDPEAPNYDPRHRVFRSPFQSSVGPWLHTGDVEAVKSILHGPYPGKNLPWEPKPMGQHASLYPVIAQLEPDWYETPERVPEIIATFNRVVLNSDSANNLAATALVTNAYLYTGEEKYRRWVLDYVEAWLDRIRANGGIIPDNVGPTGKPGEQRDGVWWGGMYGWNSKFGCRMILHAITIAAECALLLSGDFGYLELLRSQLHLLLDNAIHDAGGGLLVPWRHGPGGWARYRPMRVREPVHLWHASMAEADRDLIATLRAGDTGHDWNQVAVEGEKNEGATERPRFQYYAGQNPGWPEALLQAEYRGVMEVCETIRLDRRSIEERIEQNIVPPNPVATKALTHLTLGSPQSVYNGGLLRAQVRYFDAQRQRPGLPPDVAALVTGLSADRTALTLINLSPDQSRSVIIQSGAFGEHEIRDVHFPHTEEQGMQRTIWNSGRHAVDRTTTQRSQTVNGTSFTVHLPPFRSIDLDLELKRFARRPSYAFPWHGGRVPSVFQ